MTALLAFSFDLNVFYSDTYTITLKSILKILFELSGIKMFVLRFCMKIGMKQNCTK